MRRINVDENGLHLVFEITDQNEVKFLHFSQLPFQEELIRNEYEKTGFRPAGRKTWLKVYGDGTGISNEICLT